MVHTHADNASVRGEQSGFFVPGAKTWPFIWLGCATESATGAIGYFGSGGRCGGRRREEGGRARRGGGNAANRGVLFFNFVFFFSLARAEAKYFSGRSRQVGRGRERGTKELVPPLPSLARVDCALWSGQKAASCILVFTFIQPLAALCTARGAALAACSVRRQDARRGHWRRLHHDQHQVAGLEQLAGLRRHASHLAVARRTQNGLKLHGGLRARGLALSLIENEIYTGHKGTVTDKQ